MSQQNMSLKEEKIFSENHSTFCRTLIDIHNLLKYFVQEKVIKSEEQDGINALAKTPEKVQKLLKHVAGPLKAGDSKGFYTMLNIIENHAWCSGYKRFSSFTENCIIKRYSNS